MSTARSCVAADMKRLALSIALLLPSASLAACGSFTSADAPATPSDADAGADGAPDQLVVVPPDGPDATMGADGADAHSSDGCADGTREGFVGLPGIAACEGAWTIPGIPGDAKPLCGRAGGNGGVRADGMGCTAEDLCSPGWHVCRDALDVGAHGGAMPGGPCQGTAMDGGGAFYATAQPSGGVSTCGPAGSAGNDDIFGCADFTSSVTGCAPLNASIGTYQPSPPFSFGPGSSEERKTVVKFPGAGGVLCCL